MRGRVLAAVAGAAARRRREPRRGRSRGLLRAGLAGLYTTMLAGDTEIANPAGWLALVTYRRAIDEHRARLRAPRGACRTATRTRRRARRGRPSATWRASWTIACACAS